MFVYSRRFISRFFRRRKAWASAVLINLSTILTGCYLSLPELRGWDTALETELHEHPSEIDAESDSAGSDDTQDTEPIDSVETEGESGTETDGFDTVSDTNTAGASDSDKSSESEDESEVDTFETTDNEGDKGSDSDVVTSCENLSDFTPCVIETSPDRDYDICIDGRCLSPGCGTTECNAPGPGFALSDTGQRRCYDNFTEIDCAPSDEAWSGEDAQYGWDAAHDPTERYAFDENAPSLEPVVEDRVTGLSWQGCAVGQEGALCMDGEAETIAWDEALAACDDLEWGGNTDWRLPSRFELMSILNLGREADASYADAFPNTPLEHAFWAADTSAKSKAMSYGVDFSRGNIIITRKDLPAGYARCVRERESSAPSLPRLFDRDGEDGDAPVVLHHVTKLMWQGCVAGRQGGDCLDGEAIKTNWEEALAYCESLEWAALRDWRLPNLLELESITTAQEDAPALDTTLFPQTPSAEEDAFWTSTTALEEDFYSYAWIVESLSGTTLLWGSSLLPYKTADDFYVRCVRDQE